MIKSLLASLEANYKEICIIKLEINASWQHLLTEKTVLIGSGKFRKDVGGKL